MTWIYLLIVIVVVIIVVAIIKKQKAKELSLETTETSQPDLKDADKPAVIEAGKEPEDKLEAQGKEKDAIAQDKKPDEKGPDVPDEPFETPKTKEDVHVGPGVKLDENAEKEAAAKLKAARREKKLEKLKKRLAPTRKGLLSKISSLFKEKKTIDDKIMEELEEALITADVGTRTTEWFVSLLKEALDKEELKDTSQVFGFLKKEVTNALTIDAPDMFSSSQKPFVIMVVGVNGVGKTTTIGKFTTKLVKDGKKVVLAAADTFRAAAVKQLEIWGKRSGAEVITSQKEGADPSSVVFDAMEHAKETGADIVIADTAGRLHTKTPLMDELKKIARVMGKAIDGAPHEILMVLDATTGQNALSQVSTFKQALDVTGLALTKLDGTAKGGVIIGISHEHKIPIRFIGIGESSDDLRNFDPVDFVDALFIKENGD